MHPYEYTSPGSNFEIIQIASTSQWSHYKVTFPAAYLARYPEGNTVCGDYFTPSAVEGMPLAILVPGFGDASLTPCLMLARHLVRQGISAMVLYLAFHSLRIPADLKGQFLPLSIKEWLELYQSSVADIRRTLDWVATRKELDTARMGVVGISMGGMISSIVMAMDLRIEKGVFIVTGGNLEALSWAGAQEVIKTGHTCTREECHQVYSQFPSYLSDIAQKGIENVAPPKECFLFDPLTFARHLRGRPVLMINAEQDEIIPKQAALEFWEACGKPTLKWLPETHTSIYSSIPLISSEIADFLKGIH
ncbi:MAG: alpha/beta hydrolase family protein [Dehalococcoidales bacterium]|nr:alpha/beta hydrolase family protein [Dehalococcoidales bacterium]